MLNLIHWFDGGERQWRLRRRHLGRTPERLFIGNISRVCPVASSLAKVVYPCQEILLARLRAALAGAESFAGIALGLSASRKIFAAANPPQISAFLSPLPSPKLINSLKSLAH